jgi:hypothetical protein
MEPSPPTEKQQRNLSKIKSSQAFPSGKADPSNAELGSSKIK